MSAHALGTTRVLAEMGLERRRADVSWARRAADFDFRVFGELEAWPVADWRYLLESEECLFLAYCRPAEGMQEVGDIVALGGVAAWEESAEAEILTLGVAPTWQGRGLGGRMLDDLLKCVGMDCRDGADGREPAELDDDGGEERSAGEGVRSAVLEVRADNAAARTLYESRGFRAVGCTRGVSGAWNGILMRKEKWDVSPSC